MIKYIKIFLIKLKWILLGQKPLKDVVSDINKVQGVSVIKSTKYNGRKNYASTKRSKDFYRKEDNPYRLIFNSKKK